MSRAAGTFPKKGRKCFSTAMDALSKPLSLIVRGVVQFAVAEPFLSAYDFHGRMGKWKAM